MKAAEVLPYAVSIFTAIGGWLVGKKRRNAEAEKIEANALKGMQEAYALMVKDTTDRIKEQSLKIDKLETIILELRDEIRKDKVLISELQNKLEKLNK
jgi:predicted RNase H-like nuclease (RuvC/YqgF family)